MLPLVTAPPAFTYNEVKPKGGGEMIYVRDYSNIKPPLPYEQLIKRLSDHIGSCITVFTDSGGRSGCGFTGILIEVSSDSLRLITKLPAAPARNTGNTGQSRRYECGFGTSTVIMLSHITAFSYNYS
jgi:hypothetical protein